MRHITVVLSASGAALCCACGTASSPAGRADSPATFTDSSGSPGGGGALDGSGPDLDASQSRPGCIFGYASRRGGRRRWCR